MKDKTFNILIIIIMFIGLLSIGLLFKYTVDLSKDASITSLISNEV